MIDSIYRQFQRQLLAFINAKVADAAIAEDILQEVFIQVIKNISHLEDKTKLTAWLYQICRNKIIDYYRRQKLVTVSLDSSETHDLIAQPDSDTGIEQLESCISILIKELPDKLSGVLLESEIHSRKHKDIASTEQLSLSAVKSRVRRGRLLLKKQLQACCTIEFKQQGIESHCQRACGCS